MASSSKACSNLYWHTALPGSNIGNKINSISLYHITEVNYLVRKNLMEGVSIGIHSLGDFMDVFQSANYLTKKIELQ
jgi:hypothetical protein